MAKYIDIVLTETGTFCVSVPWSIKPGDLICLPDALAGESKLQKVIAVATDSVDGDHHQMLEKYVGNPLPKITMKYFQSEIKWEESDVQE